MLQRTWCAERILRHGLCVQGKEKLSRIVAPSMKHDQAQNHLQWEVSSVQHAQPEHSVPWRHAAGVTVRSSAHDSKGELHATDARMRWVTTAKQSSSELRCGPRLVVPRLHSCCHRAEWSTHKQERAQATITHAGTLFTQRMHARTCPPKLPPVASHKTARTGTLFKELGQCCAFTNIWDNTSGLVVGFPGFLLLRR